MDQGTELAEREQRDRDGYERFPDSLDRLESWDQAADWPADWIDSIR